MIYLLSNSIPVNETNPARYVINMLTESMSTESCVDSDTKNSTGFSEAHSIFSSSSSSTPEAVTSLPFSQSCYSQTVEHMDLSQK